LYEYRYASCPIGERLLREGQCVRKIISSGEKSKLFLGRTNVDLEKGTIAFNNKKYEEAYKRFEQAKEVDPSDPVPYIYSNNAKARLKSIKTGKPPWKLVDVVGIDFFEDTASEILRGVADSQDEFNSPDEFNPAGGKDGRLLEMVIANDGNNQDFSRKLANELVNYQDILGIIGHPASESTEPAIPIYNKKNLPLVSPTSSSSELKGNVFFRVIQSTMEASELYSNYIRNNMSLDAKQLKIFYDPNKLYSKSLKKDFEKKFTKVNSEPTLFSGDRFIDIRKKLESLKNEEVIFLIPSLDSTSLSLAFARVNNKYFKNKKIKILSSMSLAEAAIMPKKTTSSFDGLIFARPCVNEKSPYVIRAKKRWQLNTLSWRTTAGYDATQVFVKAIRLHSPQTREDMLDALKSITLSKEESSGFGLEWSQNQSNMNRPYCMYKVYQGKLIEVKVKEK
jgi:ABC-type branched-subunit amino acid transport system substrate-binding protein